MRNTLITALVLSLAVNIDSLLAQNFNSIEFENKIIKISEKEQRNTLSNSDNLTTLKSVSSPHSAFQIEAIDNSGKAIIKVSSKGQAGQNDNGISFTRDFTFTLETPLDKNNRFTDLANLDGMTNSTNLSVTAKWSAIGGFKSEKELLLSCNYDAFKNEIKTKCLTKGNDQKDESFNKCTEEILISKCNLLKSNPGNKKIHYWGGQLKTGRDSFDVYNIADFSKNGVTKSPNSFSLFYGYIAPDFNSGWLAGLDYQKVYQASKNKTFCMEQDMNLLECKTGSFDAPSRTNKRLIFIEYRYRRKSGDFAIEPRITYDLEKDTTGIDLPIMVLKNKDGKLKGGIRLGWRDDTKDITAGIFVGSSFDIWGTK